MECRRFFERKVVLIVLTSVKVVKTSLCTKKTRFVFSTGALSDGETKNEQGEVEEEKKERWCIGFRG